MYCCATPMQQDRVSAFVNAYQEHSDSVVRAAQEILRDRSQAEDVAQEVFIAYWGHPDRYDPARGGLGTYLRVMARSRAMDALRSQSATQRARDRLEDATLTERRGQHQAPVGARLEHAHVRTAVRGLPEPQREALALTFWGGFTSREIAHNRALPLGTVKSRVRLGLRRLRSDALAGSSTH